MGTPVSSVDVRFDIMRPRAIAAVFVPCVAARDWVTIHKEAP